jgi:hypothetical protein
MPLHPYMPYMVFLLRRRQVAEFAESFAMNLLLLKKRGHEKILFHALFVN